MFKRIPNAFMHFLPFIILLLSFCFTITSCGQKESSIAKESTSRNTVLTETTSENNNEETTVSEKVKESTESERISNTPTPISTTVPSPIPTQVENKIEVQKEQSPVVYSMPQPESQQESTLQPTNAPTLLPPLEKPKVSGIDPNATAVLSSLSEKYSLYKGRYKPLFDQYLLDIVNKKMTPEEVYNKILPMRWDEEWVRAGEGIVTYIPNPNRVITGTYETSNTGVEEIYSGANNTIGMGQFEYKQTIVYFNADTQKFTLYFLGIKFSYMKTSQTPIIEETLTGYFKKQKFNNNTYKYTLIQDDTNDLLVINEEYGVNLNLEQYLEKRVKVTGKSISSGAKTYRIDSIEVIEQ